MLQSLLATVLVAVQAPVGAAPEPGPVAASEPAAAPGVAAAPAPAPVSAPAVTPAVTPAPAPVAGPAVPDPSAPQRELTPAPVTTSTYAAAPPGPVPAVGPTTATVRNSEHGAVTPISESNFKIGKGFAIGTKDGRFSLQIRGRMQLRYDVEHYNTVGEAAKDVAQALQVRRMRLLLQGAVFSPYVKYHFQFGFSPRDMQNDLPNENGSIRRNPLRDARLEFDRLRDFTVWIGQFKVPFSRQRMLSSAYMNMVDRSIVNAEFNLDRDIGVQIMSRDIGGLGGRLAYYAGVFMGEGRNSFDLSDSGLLYAARFEVRPFGKFDDYYEGDVDRSGKPALSIAGAYAFQDRAHAARGVVGDRPLDGGTTDFHHATADLIFKFRGFSFASAFHLRKGFNRKSGGALDEGGLPIATVAARSGMAWYAQTGYVVPKIPLEIVGRYGLMRNTYGAQSSMINSDEAGGGLNYYFVGHDLKLQLDYFRLGDATMGATTAEALRHGTDRVRVQVQLYF